MWWNPVWKNGRPPRCSLLSYRRCFTQPVQQSPTTAARRKRKLTQYPSHESVCRKVRRSREFTAPPRRRANSPSLKSHRSLLHGFGSDELYWRLHGLIRAGTAKLTHVELKMPLQRVHTQREFSAHSTLLLCRPPPRNWRNKNVRDEDGRNPSLYSESWILSIFQTLRIPIFCSCLQNRCLCGVRRKVPTD